jgi:nucleoside 2-deoxyribosyltransferase
VKNNKVYLAGPIGGLTVKDSTTWRDLAMSQLARHGLQGFSPMRAKEFLDNGEPLSSVPNQYPHPLATSKGIMARDFNDCTTAAVILVNYLGVSKVSLGTAMELAWAYDRHIPTVVVSEFDNPNVLHPMAHEAISFRVESLQDAINLTATIINPGVFK